VAGRRPRYAALDSLRGLAALSVVLSHIYRALFGTKLGTALAPYLDRTPLQVLVNGEGAVLLFFVLSGLVLALSTDVATPLQIGAYYVRRVARIWLPYLCALLAFVVACQITRGMLNGPYTVMNGSFALPFDLRSLLVHLSLIGSLNQYEYLGVSWSLVHEMRASLLFPLLLLALRGRAWVVTAASGLLLLLGGHALAVRYGEDQYSTGLINTVYYVGLFVLGILVAQQRATIMRLAATVPRVAVYAVLALALVLYEGNLLWPGDPLAPPIPFAEIAGCGLLVSVGLCLDDRDKILGNAVVRWLGRISYSLYLWHPLFVLVLYRTLNAVVGPVTLSALVLVCSLALATLGHRWIEIPAIALGRRLSDRLRG